MGGTNITYSNVFVTWPGKSTFNATYLTNYMHKICTIFLLAKSLALDQVYHWLNDQWGTTTDSYPWKMSSQCDSGDIGLNIFQRNVYHWNQCPEICVDVVVVVNAHIDQHQGWWNKRFRAPLGLRCFLFLSLTHFITLPSHCLDQGPILWTKITDFI